MKKLFLMFSFILLTVTKIFGQAAVDITLFATDGSFTIPISVGLDLTATNCIDPQLGESDLPPVPPTGIFDARFDLTPYGCWGMSSYKDYRAPGNPPAFPFTGMIEHTLWWQVTTPGLPVNITYNLPLGVIMNITDNITGTLLNLGPFIGQGVATIPGSYTVFATKAYLKMDYDNIVPVELTSFSASVLQNEKAVQLNWSTATETNNSGFEVHRKKLEARSQELEWETIAFVPGFGTTTEPKSYSFNDENVSTGTYKYRLKQIDFDGSFEYLPIGQAGSKEIEVVVDFTPKEFVLYQNYPNPFNPSTVIKFAIPKDSDVNLSIYNVLGEMVTTLVNEEMKAGYHQVDFNAANLATGVYLYRIKAGSFVETKKMVLMK